MFLFCNHFNHIFLPFGEGFLFPSRNGESTPAPPPLNTKLGSDLLITRRSVYFSQYNLSSG